METIQRQKTPFKEQDAGSIFMPTRFYSKIITDSVSKEVHVLYEKSNAQYPLRYLILFVSKYFFI